MGCGKTTIGQLLAKKLNCTFIDLDGYIENRFSKSIPTIFEEKGENGFREIENAMLKEVVEIEDIIVSTGGGAACFFNNMEIMNQAGKTIYLKMSAEKLAERLYLAKNNRPLIKDRSKEELPVFIAEMLAKREPFYEQSAIILQNENKTAETACNEIVAIL